MYKLIVTFLLSFNFLIAQNIQSIFLDSANKIPLLTFDKPTDIQELLNQEVIKGQMFNFGKFVLCDISSSEHGLWTEVDGGKVWTLAIEAKNAKGISLYYDDFWIPSSGELYIYNPMQTQKIGPFTSKHNHSSGLFATEVIHGEILVLEYFQPEYENNDLKLSRNRFAYAYRDISGGQLNGYNSSDE